MNNTPEMTMKTVKSMPAYVDLFKKALSIYSPPEHRDGDPQNESRRHGRRMKSSQHVSVVVIAEKYHDM
jgi:hypothetical protein